MTVFHENNATRWLTIADASQDMVIYDPPFTLSKSADADGEEEIGLPGRANVRRDFGEWDKKYDPWWDVQHAARVLLPGGLLIIKTGDPQISTYRDICAWEDANTETQIRYLRQRGLIDRTWGSVALSRLRESQPIAPFTYHNTVTWHKTNPMVRIRKTGLVFSCEWIQIFVRNDPEGNPVPLRAFNWISVPSMHNHFEAPICSSPERLYWHRIDCEIYPCYGGLCRGCEEGHKRRSHPTQTPLRVWDWVFRRYCTPGIGTQVYDPYAGLGTIGQVAYFYGCNYFGSEINWEYATVARMWEDCAWQRVSLGKSDSEQLEVIW